MQKATLFFDGGTFPLNPGHGGAGAFLVWEGQEYSFSEYLGPNTTNNQAEYQGLILGLKQALELKIPDLKIFGDSQLVIYQMVGQYACRDFKLRPLNQQAQDLSRQFKSCVFCWIPREQNVKADQAATQALKSFIPQIIIPENLPINPPREGLQKAINRLNKVGEGAKFKEWLKLRSGRDQFSSLKGTKLEAVVPQEVREAIAKSVANQEDPEIYTKALRWWLRGLKAEYALKKARVDAEISRNFSKTREREN